MAKLVTGILYAFIAISLGCKDPDYMYSLENFDKVSGDNILLILHGEAYYDHYTKKFHEYMEEVGNLTLFDIVESDPADFNLSNFDQIWMFDMGVYEEMPVNLINMLDNVASWFNNHPEKNVIFDSRFFCSLDYPNSGTPYIPEKQLIENYFINLKMRGGGLFVGTDDEDYAKSANYLMELLNFGKFDGKANIFLFEAESTHPILFYPAYGHSSENDDKYYFRGCYTVAQTLPNGLQNNGILLYTVGYANDINGNPHITTSIPPSDFTFEKHFLCTQTLMYSTEWQLGEVVKFHSTSDIQVKITSNILGTYFSYRTEDSIIKASLPKYPGEHEMKLKLISKNEQSLTYVFNVTVQLDKEEVECTNQNCSCNNGMECILENNTTLIKLDNEGYLHINESMVIKVIYAPNTTIINSTNGVVDIDGGNLIIILPETFDEDEGNLDILVGSYSGKFNEVIIESNRPIKSCEEFKSDIKYAHRHISVAFSLKKSCIKWWVYLLIGLGILVILVAMFLVIIYKVDKLRQRILPFSG